VMVETPGGRVTRKSRKAVDYAKEQDFSDTDIFEDDANDQPEPTRRRGRPRKNIDHNVEETDYGPMKPVYTEKGYDPTLLPIRERFSFLPEFEADGSPRIELIVGRRPYQDKNSQQNGEEDHDDADENPRSPSRRRGSSPNKKNDKSRKGVTASSSDDHVEYEYLIKYKGKSYLHLEYKKGADLESMNKSAKTLYRRYLKKLASGNEDDLEDVEFDQSFAQPQKIVDEGHHEVTVELTDSELIKWEQQREREMEEEEDDDEEEVKIAGAEDEEVKKEETEEEKIDERAEKEDLVNADEELDFSSLSLEKLRRIVNSDGPYYPIIDGSTNPYRDGYITEPPKKPRASYLFFQCSLRSYYQRKNPNAGQSELMTLLGDTWRNMSEEEHAPFIQLAAEETKQHDKERAMMEKAQKPNEVWQPLRRCLMVLDRLSNDGFANIFLEPVNTEDFPDYEEIIDQPMDLDTVRKKLASKKYQMPENFARDMRRIWNNCKIYNQHGSAIWFVADYMSKQFERLYNAWVLEFRDRFLRWAHPKARPWEHNCRKCDGKCGTSDDKMVLCDHCDAMYGISCVKLKKIPQGIWHCPECKPKLKTNKNIRMLSAIAEAAARRKAELGDVPKKKVLQKMYLVKWAGLGYEFCTWETKADINDDALIMEYQRLNNMTPDEPDLTEKEVKEVIEKAKHVALETAGGSLCIPDLRVQLYAQSRAFQFSKFGSDIPDALSGYVGPKTTAITTASQDEASVEINRNETTKLNQVPSSDITTKTSKYPLEVMQCVYDLSHRVARSNSQKLMNINSNVGPLLTGEYDAIIPITSRGLMMNVGEIHGSVAFLGYRLFPDDSKGPAELANIIRNVGDKIIAVDGVSTIDKTFKEVIGMLRESGKNKYAFMRFLENRFSACSNDLTSLGASGSYALVELRQKISGERKRLLFQRKQKFHHVEESIDIEEEEEKVIENDEEESEEDGSEGEFEPDSDDEDLGQKVNSESPENGKIPLHSGAPTIESKKGGNRKDANIAKSEEANCRTVVVRQETTQSLANRLLDIDVGYSSDECCDEDCIFYVDGVDETFTTSIKSKSTKEVLQDATGEEPQLKSEKDEAEQEKFVLPMKRNEFSSLGERAKVNAAIAVTTLEADPSDFVEFPGPSPKEIEARQKAEEEAKQGSEVDLGPGGEAAEQNSPTKTKRSTVKVEQISVATGDAMHVWANAEAAAATLQISLDDIKRMLKGKYDEELGDEVGGYRWKYALAGAEVTAKGVGGSSRGSKKGKEAFLEFRDKLYDHADPHVYINGNRLRDYQVDGVNWLASTWYKRHSCILADEMGLGKTVQIVSYIEHIYRVEKIHRPFLVVVPLSTVEHWRREFLGWTNMVCCVYHDRQRVWRDVMREYEWYFDDRPHTPDFLKFDVLVTTYDTLIGDFDIIGQIPWRVAVVDEAHRLRNIKGKLLECMKEISARGTLHYGFQSRVLMTGTPLQNNTQELWTLLNFIEPYKFPSLEDFQLNFGNMANREQVEALQREISPYMLRRVKEDVAKDIPAKEETVIDVELTSIQKQYYRAIFEHNHAFLSMGASRTNAPKLMNIQMELRKCCNHPFLLDGVEQRETDRFYSESLNNGEFKGKSSDEQQIMINESGYVHTSGKMVLLDKLLPKLREEGHKVLIFSQMVKMLDLISEYAEFRGFRHERLDGRVRGNERQKSIDRFETEKDSFMFLLSTRAGGVGINLTAADTCIIFDSDWNPQNDVQAQARCHRIGQTKDVRIYRLVTSRTFEQEMFDRASKKLGLEQAVLGTFNQDDDDDKPTSKEMEQLLKKGAYALLEDENDEVTKQFCADDIDAILAKRTRTRVVEGTKTASWLNKQGMVVSKSKFTADSTSAGVNVDDPNFWQKVMPDFVTPQIMIDKLDELSMQIDGKKAVKGRGRRGRKRKQQDPSEEETNEDGEEKVEDADAQENDDEEKGEKSDDGNDEDNDEKTKPRGKVTLSRTSQRKVHKFISDLKSMMDGILEEAEDDSLPSGDKQACQKLLLTISVKESLFNEEQRHLARSLLKRLEGDRRRRCRTSTDGPGSRFSNPRAREVAGDGDKEYNIPDDLLILSKQQRRKRQKKDELDDEPKTKRKKKRGAESNELDDDGYLRHSDDEEDWSDIGDDIYDVQHKNRATISVKEAKRRRGWAHDDDAATAAGRPWPAFPRHLVKKVLGTVIDEVIEYDKSKGGMFSEPVPPDEYPSYYEQIKKPMDYGTMKEKLENGEYRSAQAMQKDFVLVMQNCLKFNAPDSDVVKEVRQQALMRPQTLRNAAQKHKIFLAEDGSALEILDEKEKKEATNPKGTPKKRRRRKNGDETEGEKERKVIRRRKKKKDTVAAENDDDNTISDKEGEVNHDEKIEDDLVDSSPRKKPRIKISINGDDKAKKKRGSKRKGKKNDADLEDEGAKVDDEKTLGPKKRRKKNGSDETMNGSDLEVVEDSKELSVKKMKVDKSQKTDSDGNALYFNTKYWKAEREKLDGSFFAARELFMKHGPWVLPDGISADSFVGIATAVIAKMSKHDRYDVFTEAVTEEEAPGYYDVVKEPMDFSKMMEKIESGEYEEGGSDAISSLCKDFLLIFDNCDLYNDEEGEVVSEAARLFGILPETYSSVCRSFAGKRKKVKEKMKTK